MMNTSSTFEHSDEHRLGEACSPDGFESPHQYDYKLSILDPLHQDTLMGMLSEERDSPGSVLFSLEWFREHGSFRRFTHSQEKRGLFVQASCIVTTGFRSAGSCKISHVLIAERSPYQFHLPKEGRNLDGPSVLFSTALASFEYQDTLGHVPTALFNDLHSYCPWALFARKLLLPDLYMDSRFLGIAYNFVRSDRRYVFLVWHVRTKNMPESMLVPVRQAKEFDLPKWTRTEAIPWARLGKDTIGRMILSHLGMDIGRTDEECSSSNDAFGFLPHCRFEGVAKRREMAQVVGRDEIGLDILRMYQQEFHGGRRGIREEDVSKYHERALQKDLYNYLDDHLGRQRLRFTLDWELPQGPMPKAGRADVVLAILDENGAPMYRYLFECKLSSSAKTRENYISQGQEYCAAYSKVSPSARKDEGLDAVFLVHGITNPENRYAIQDTITIPSEDIPLHVLRIALRPEAPSLATGTVDVAHALIPIRVNDGPPEWLLFVKGADDVCPQVLGGKAEMSKGRRETPRQTLLREMNEEIGLQPYHVKKFHAVFPGAPGKMAGIPFQSLSVTRGVYRNYRFHPFVVFLTDEGKAHVRRKLHQPDHFAQPLLIRAWIEHGYGHLPDYARAVAPFLNEDLLNAAAVEIHPGNLVGGTDEGLPPM